MHYLSRGFAVSILVFIPLVQTFGASPVEVLKVMHEELSLNHGIYSPVASNRWASESAWFQNPGVSLRFGAGHQEAEGIGFESESYTPEISVRFQTVGQLEVGVMYAHTFFQQTEFFYPFGKFQFEGDTDSVGGYLARQFDCGFRVGAGVSYSASSSGPEGSSRRSHSDTFGASGGIGFARSFGEKRFGRNVFVDTSANFLYYSEVEKWYFVWMTKLGHNLTENIAVYGLFNLFCSGSRPDATSGEAGGGIFIRCCEKLRLTAEAATPVLDDSSYRTSSYYVRTGLHFDF